MMVGGCKVCAMTRITSDVKYFISNLAKFLWYVQQFIRMGTFSPSIKSINLENKRIFVLGNGPSLTKDISNFTSYLKCEDVMMVNQALTSSLAFEIRPRYYTLMDPAYWGLYSEDENQNNRLLNDIVALESALTKVNWHMNILAPHSIYKCRTNKSIKINNNKISVKLLNSMEVTTFKFLQEWIYKNSMGIPSGINVLIACLCCAIAIGYKEIFLIGADSNWHKQLLVDSNNNLYTYDTHYYHSEAHKVYTPYTMAFVCNCITKAFSAYQELSHMKFKIINLSSNSMIDAFPRNTIKNIIGGGEITI